MLVLIQNVRKLYDSNINEMKIIQFISDTMYQ